MIDQIERLIVIKSSQSYRACFSAPWVILADYIGLLDWGELITVQFLPLKSSNCTKHSKKWDIKKLKTLKV